MDFGFFLSSRFFFFCLSFLISSDAFCRDGFTLNFWQPSVNQSMLIQQVRRASQLGATHFNIPALLCQDHKDSVAIEWCYNQGPASTQGIKLLAKEMNALGFTFSFLPLLIARDGSWRGQFVPSNFLFWSQSYEQRINELIAVARETKAVEFIVGSEFNDLYRQEAFWRRLIGQVRRALPRAAVFTVANWDQVERVPFWDACDYIALSAYYPLARWQDKNPDFETLVSAWRPWKQHLLGLARSQHKPLYFAEVGYRSVDSAAATPWESAADAPLNLDLQANLYKALAHVWANQPEVRRLMIWWLSPAANPVLDKGYDILGKPAEQEVAIMMGGSRLVP